MRAAELKFNESMDESYSKMVAISNAEEMYMGQLAKFYDCELEYFQRNVQILTDIREIFNESNYSKYYQTTRRSPSLALRGEHQVSRSKSHRVNLSPNYEDQEPSFSPPNRNPSGYNKAGYFDTARTNSETSEEMMPTGGGGYSAPGRVLTKTPSFGSDHHVPPLPQRGSQKELVRVLYDYDGDTTDELPIRKGDTVTVLDKIDEGWWIGEIVDEFGRRAGMFPSNYVEEIAPDLPPSASMPKRSYTTTAPQRAAAAPNSINRYNTLIPDSVPIQTEPSMQGESIGRRRQAPLPPHGSGGSNQISPGNTRSNPSEIRRPSIPFHSNANTLKAQAPSNSPFDDDNAGGIISCQECGCTDYKANVFKQNSCNNCFHTH
ncbi:hypothetical protein K7432_005929 [Basidiobolus ranarum]|uniref:SH3 domain-containing protein n=1 Tax=Basidiobolus ranarum TaxID=34480 RepID=A0ABR2W2W2_9FUNG